MVSNEEEKRIKFHQKLVSILGSNNVYFQPPENLKISYPCFIYNRVSMKTLRANNSVYKVYIPYQLTYISKTNDMKLLTDVLSIPYCEHSRSYVSDNLYHDVYNVYC